MGDAFLINFQELVQDTQSGEDLTSSPRGSDEENEHHGHSDVIPLISWSIKHNSPLFIAVQTIIKM